jgi:hypothetical protein
MDTINLPPGHTLGHHAGYANYSGDRRSIVGEPKGPTTYGRIVVAVAADYDETADRTRVEFRFIDRPDEVA